ncbi:peptide chain release factor-like protein [Symmachiella dynata]|uniref:peptide chain release factor family protein n=1 Tax=Symmachiella dynata TaxID=2527995 RepID=UPI0030EED3C7
MESAIHPAALSVAELLPQCEVTRTRGSGPGGQHRNKVETAIILLHRPTGTHGEASERRSQAENQTVALFRLRVNLALAVRMKKNTDGEVDPVWTSRIVGGRISINPAHEDFPTLLAEALDWIKNREFDLKAAAEKLGCTGSQLTKFLKREPRAWSGVNANRKLRGLHPLK